LFYLIFKFKDYNHIVFMFSQLYSKHNIIKIFKDYKKGLLNIEYYNYIYAIHILHNLIDLTVG